MGGVNIPLEANNLQISQPVDPLGEYLRASQLKTEAGQQQIQQQTIQQNAQALKDQQAMTQAMHDWDGKDLESLPNLILKSGGSANAVFNVQKQLLERKTQIAQLDKDTLVNSQAHNDAQLGALKSLDSVPDEELPTRLAATAQDLLAKGHLDQAHLPAIQQIAQQAASDPVKARQNLSIIEKGLMGEKEQFSQAKDEKEQQVKQQEANAKDWQKDDALGVFLNTRTGEVKSPAGQVMSPAMLESKYIMNQQRARLGQQLSPEDQAFQKSFEHYKTMVPAFNFNLQAGGVGGSGAPPSGPSGQPLPYADQIKSFGPKGGVVKAIIEGRQDPPASFAQKSPYWQDVMQKVYAVDPEFNQQRAQLRKAYSSGTQSKEINAINTAMGHVGVLGDAIDALNNNDVKALNRVANAVGVQFGKDNVTTFNTIVHRVGPEIAKAYIGAGGSAGERGADEKDFDPSLGTQQLKSNVGITAQLLRSKIGALQNQWDQNKAPSMPSFEQQFIMPEAKKQLDKWSPQGTSQSGGISVKAPNGKTYQFKDQAAADAFKKAANIQ